MLNALGIDVSKDKLDVVLLSAQDQSYNGVFTNNQQGFEQLQRWCEKKASGTMQVCLEATGQYSTAVAEFLHQLGYSVSVVNPARIKAFAASRLSRQKTDQSDARLIALFCLTQQPEAWTPPPAEQRTLQALVRYLRDLKAMRQQEQNRLTSGLTAATVLHALQQHITFLDEQIRALQYQIREHLQQHPQLRQQRDLLDSIPGLGETTIAILLAEMPDVQNLDKAPQLAAYAGVTPRHFR